MVSGVISGKVPRLKRFKDLLESSYVNQVSFEEPDCMKVPDCKAEASMSFEVQTQWIDFNLIRRPEFFSCKIKIQTKNTDYEKAKGTGKLQVIKNDKLKPQPIMKLSSFDFLKDEDEDELLDDFITLELYEERRGRA